MLNYWTAGAVSIGLMTGSGLGQTTGPQPAGATNDPGGTVQRAHVGIVVDSTGAATGTSDTSKKIQSYTRGDGRLGDRTDIESTGPTTTTEK